MRFFNLMYIIFIISQRICCAGYIATASSLPAQFNLEPLCRSAKEEVMEKPSRLISSNMFRRNCTSSVWDWENSDVFNFHSSNYRSQCARNSSTNPIPHSRTCYPNTIRGSCSWVFSKHSNTRLYWWNQYWRGYQAIGVWTTRCLWYSRKSSGHDPAEISSNNQYQNSRAR